MAINLKDIFIAAFVGISVGGAAHAGTPQRIILIQTDDAPGNTYINVTQGDDGTLQSLTYEAAPSLTFTMADLQNGPVVLKQRSGKDAVRLKLEQPFDPVHGGHVVVQFLNNGITNCYEDFRILFDVQGTTISVRSDPDPSDPDSDNNPYTSVFNKLFMFKKTVMFGKEIGIESIAPSVVPATDVTNGPDPIPDPSDHSQRLNLNLKR